MPISVANAIIPSFRLGSKGCLYTIGSFDSRVTVLSQQRRALNLAWALIEAGKLSSGADQKQVRVAVIGAGFAGLTFAAALLKKRCDCSISVFEERDTLLPMQQGSDTRWLHPHIYDWPQTGSDANAAMLPLMNWTAARASDVVVQVLASWKEILAESLQDRLELYCNTRHLQVQVRTDERYRVEWVGELRDKSSGNSSQEGSDTRGQSELFDIVVLATGFGIEIETQSSYWRSEEYGQPSLGQPHKTFLISGQGDGALIDLQRLKISQYRQDRILAELFRPRPELVQKLREMRDRFIRQTETSSLFERFERLRRGKTQASNQLNEAVNQLARRLRRDTDIILKLRVRNLSELLKPNTGRMSFQNALMTYLLYRAGGFAPSMEEIDVLATRFSIPPENIIRRHGTDRIAHLSRFLATNLAKSIAAEWGKDRCASKQQSADIHWPGGYFGTPLRSKEAGTLSDDDRQVWRKEYLPGPTALIGISVSGAVAAMIMQKRPKTKNLRVTLHRVLAIHDEELLQQTCDYVGRTMEKTEFTSARTFPAANATIGQAYETRSIVRSTPGITPMKLNQDMQELKLNDASRKMSDKVGFVVAIPVLQPENEFYLPSPVCAVVYFDSKDAGFDLGDDELADIVTLIGNMLENIRVESSTPLNRLENTPLSQFGKAVPTSEPLASLTHDGLTISKVRPPILRGGFVLNYDHSDLTPLVN